MPVVIVVVWEASNLMEEPAPNLDRDLCPAAKQHRAHLAIILCPDAVLLHLLELVVGHCNHVECGGTCRQVGVRDCGVPTAGPCMIHPPESRIGIVFGLRVATYAEVGKWPPLLVPNASSDCNPMAHYAWPQQHKHRNDI